MPCFTNDDMTVYCCYIIINNSCRTWLFLIQILLKDMNEKEICCIMKWKNEQGFLMLCEYSLKVCYDNNMFIQSEKIVVEVFILDTTNFAR